MTQDRTLISALYDQPSGLDSLFTRRLFGSEGYEKIKGDKVLILWGGEDISPTLYGETPNSHTHASSILSRRDQIEKRMAEWFIANEYPIIGICRGAQLMCALSGGKLIQHVDNHYGHHNIHCPEVVPGLGDIELDASSIHHQMLNPTGVDHILLGHTWDKRGTLPTMGNISSKYIGEGDKPVDLPPDFHEPEIVWFPKTKALCIQGHPEYMSSKSNYVKYICDLVDHFCFSKKSK
jgi:gamma-glutamyl-gamma-aminobutyrate hydrolase PuuD